MHIMLQKKLSLAVVLLIVAGIMFLFLTPDRGGASSIEKQPSSLDGIDKMEALKLGERMYREGILLSGKPMQAIVQGDIPVEGTMFACVSCHLRSGKGSLEGWILTFPVDGQTLYKPLSYAGKLTKLTQESFPYWVKKGYYRPAYTDESLAVAIRGGIDPNGRILNYAMPRYPLEDLDMDILILYLKGLSAGPVPGITDTTMNLATVITDDVSQQDREAMLAPLDLFIKTWGKTRRLEGRSRRAAGRGDLDEETTTGFKKLVLQQWELKGPAATWRTQLEEYYRKDPVFALVGGISNLDWAPVHDFCEQNRIPCLFPITDFPVVSDRDWYTLYFSKGFYQEGEAAAKYLNGMADLPTDAQVVQVLRGEDRRSLAISKGFLDTWRGLNRPEPGAIILNDKEAVDSKFWAWLSEKYKNAVKLLWLDPKDISSLGASEIHSQSQKMIFLSSGMLGNAIYSVPERLRSSIFITYPYRLPEEYHPYEGAINTWLRNNKITPRNFAVEARVYYLISALSRGLSMLQFSYNRERLLEQQDMMIDDVTAATYPRLSFGPGQRYASKGCYIVQISEGPAPVLIDKSGWVIP